MTVTFALTLGSTTKFLPVCFDTVAISDWISVFFKFSVKVLSSAGSCAKPALHMSNRPTDTPLAVRFQRNILLLFFNVLLFS